MVRSLSTSDCSLANADSSSRPGGETAACGGTVREEENVDPSHATPAAPSGPRLLRLARESIEHELGGPEPELPRGVPYDRLAATFVTVLRSGSLHGCIGTLEAVRTLAEDVRHHAVGAAMYDPRSRRLAKAELPQITIEISVLSALEPVEASDEGDAIRKLQPGIDGVVLRYGSARATFLPQVWEKLPDARQFLTQLKRKAGLSSWPNGMSVYRYRVEKYEEPCTEEAMLNTL